MKSFFRLPNLLLLAIAIFTAAACTKDPEFKIPPSVDFLSATGFLTADATIGAGDVIKVRLSATKGDNPMKAVEFQQDGARISDATRITIDGAAASSAAPLLFDAAKDDFTWDVEITPHADGAADYTFIVSDDGGESASKTITITIEKDPPVLTAPNGVLALEAEAGQRTTISLKANSPSGADLTTLSVFENGSEAVGADRFWFAGIMATDAFEGSITLGDAYKGGFTEDLFIRANETAGTTDSYSVIVTDANGLTASLDITVKATDSGTPLDGNFKGILLNKSGPQGQGGLDLDTGNGQINSTDPSAEIKDEGIDTGQPDATNWKQQISPANNSQLGYVSPSNFPENTNFDDITTKEQVQSIAEQTTQIGVSNKVVVGDVFAVYNPTLNRFYLIRVSDIMLTDSDNKDAYTFDIKW